MTAAKAAPAGYSGTPLPKKLGLKDGGTMVLIDAPPAVVDAIAPMPPGAAVSTTLKAGTTLALLCCKNAAALKKKFAATTAKMDPAGSLWIAWPKKTSPQFVDLTEDGIREVVLPTGWVDVKVCAVDQDWSGLKLMLRRERR